MTFCNVCAKEFANAGYEAHVRTSLKHKKRAKALGSNDAQSSTSMTTYSSNQTVAPAVPTNPPMPATSPSMNQASVSGPGSSMANVSSVSVYTRIESQVWYHLELFRRYLKSRTQNMEYELRLWPNVCNVEGGLWITMSSTAWVICFYVWGRLLTMF